MHTNRASLRPPLITLSLIEFLKNVFYELERGAQGLGLKISPGAQERRGRQGLIGYAVWSFEPQALSQKRSLSYLAYRFGILSFFHSIHTASTDSASLNLAFSSTVFALDDRSAWPQHRTRCQRPAVVKS